VLLATDIATLAIPVAKAGAISGQISKETAEAAIAKATRLGYGAAVAQGALAGHDAYEEGGLTWSNSAQLMDAFLILASVKLDARGALKEINTGHAASLADVDVDKALKHVDAASVKARVPTLQVVNQTCFVAGTPLLTPDGEKPVEHFAVGDKILSRPETDPSAPLTTRTIEAVFELCGQVVELHIGGRVIETTAEHPFYVAGKGWRRCFELESADQILGHDGSLTDAMQVVLTNRTATVYNVRVSDDHTYFVGSQVWGFSLWAHNAYEAKKVDGVWVVLDDYGNKVEVDLLPNTQANALAHAAYFENPKNFAGIVRGKSIPMGQVPFKEVTLTRVSESTAKEVWDAFNKKGGAREKFLTKLASDPAEITHLKQAGLTDIQIAEMKQTGKAPPGYQVHHKIARGWGGTNDFSNLILIKNDPYHLALTSALTWFTNIKKTAPGTTITVDFPIPNGHIFVPPKLN
jgi:hypothetical protein